MRRSILAAVAAAVCLIVPAAAMAASGPTGSTTCAAVGVPGVTSDGIPTTDVYGTVATNFTVPAGAPLCRVMGAEIKGNTSVAGTLKAFGGTFDGNVSVNGGSFSADNHPVTINGNLSFVDPAANSQNGVWPAATGSRVTGNISYVIDSSASYPCYQWPSLYLHGIKVNRNLSYTGYTFNNHLDADLTGVAGSQTITPVQPQSC
jgi:hypothetical protein